MRLFKQSPQLFCFAWLLIFLSFSFVLSAQNEEFSFPDFYQSLNRHGKSQNAYKKIFTNDPGDINHIEYKEATEKFREIYDKNKKGFTQDETAPLRIPNIIHQIWLGSPVPEKFRAWMSSWINMQGWEYKLWTDKEVANFPLHNQKLYDQAKDYGEKSDILRYEILYKEGGIYADMDCQCLRPELFGPFNRSFDFYAGFEPIEHKQIPNCPMLGNAFIASVPGHPILRRLILNLETYYQKRSQDWAVVSTGPVYFTKTVLSYLKKERKEPMIFLPPTFLFPIRAAEAGRLQDFMRLETLMIHYFAGSWITPKTKKN